MGLLWLIVHPRFGAGFVEQTAAHRSGLLISKAYLGNWFEVPGFGCKDGFESAGDRNSRGHEFRV